MPTRKSTDTAATPKRPKAASPTAAPQAFVRPFVIPTTEDDGVPAVSLADAKAAWSRVPADSVDMVRALEEAGASGWHPISLCEALVRNGDFDAADAVARTMAAHEGNSRWHAMLAWSAFARGRLDEGRAEMARALVRFAADAKSLYLPVAYFEAIGDDTSAAVAYYGPEHWKRTFYGLKTAYPHPPAAKAPAKVLAAYAALYSALVEPAWQLEQYGLGALTGLLDLFEGRFGASAKLRGRIADLEAAIATRRQALEQLAKDASSDTAADAVVERARAFAPERGDDETPAILRRVGLALMERGASLAAADVFEVALRAGVTFAPVELSADLVNALLAAGEVERAGRHLDALFEAGSQAPATFHTAARLCVRLGKHEWAFRAITAAKDFGYEQYATMADDPELAPLRDDPAWSQAFA